MSTQSNPQNDSVYAAVQDALTDDLVSSKPRKELKIIFFLSILLFFAFLFVYAKCNKIPVVREHLQVEYLLSSKYSVGTMMPEVNYSEFNGYYMLDTIKWRVELGSESFGVQYGSARVKPFRVVSACDRIYDSVNYHRMLDSLLNKGVNSKYNIYSYSDVVYFRRYSTKEDKKWPLSSVDTSKRQLLDEKNDQQISTDLFNLLLPSDRDENIKYKTLQEHLLATHHPAGLGLEVYGGLRKTIYGYKAKQLIDFFFKWENLEKRYYDLTVASNTFDSIKVEFKFDCAIEAIVDDKDNIKMGVDKVELTLGSRQKSTFMVLFKDAESLQAIRLFILGAFLTLTLTTAIKTGWTIWVSPLIRKKKRVTCKILGKKSRKA